MITRIQSLFSQYSRLLGGLLLLAILAVGLMVTLRFTRADPSLTQTSYLPLLRTINPSAAFREQGGLVCLEAEHYATIINRGDHRWEEKSLTPAGYVGPGYMEAAPNTGAGYGSGFAVISPALTYNIRFTQTGTYYIWVRGSATNSNDNTVHFGLNGSMYSSADRLSLPPNGQWVWSKQTLDGHVASLSITSAGQHVLNLWMHTDGIFVDRILLTTNPNYVPSNKGPAESGYGAGATPTITRTKTPTTATIATRTATRTPVSPTATRTATRTPTVGITVTPGTTQIQESFEAEPTGWTIQRSSVGSGSITRSTLHANDGIAAARLATTSRGSRAQLYTSYSDPASAHIWKERPGSWRWQQASVFIPASTLSGLGSSDYLTLAGFWPTAGGSFGWYVRIRQNGALYAFGYTSDGQPSEINLYGTFPTNRWVELEIGLHTQAGPGVKRAFAVLIDGQFYGWFRQGHMVSETYDRVALGLLEVAADGTREIFIDRWRKATSAALPGGPDLRSAAAVQEQNFRSQSGVQVQYDWSTWIYKPVLQAGYGLSVPSGRLQAGRNIDRMPSVESGWAEIEIDWPRGTPPLKPSSYFGPMVGWAKEINREENLEIIPIGDGTGKVMLTFEAWVENPFIQAQWPLPTSSINSTSHVPEPGDIIRVRWEKLNTTTMNVRASYYDASAARWYTDIISGNYAVSAINGVNYFDGYHRMSSITIDSHYYSIRRYKVGTLATYP